MARVILTRNEIDDLNDLATRVLAGRAGPPCGEMGIRTITLWLTWWNLALANIRDEADGTSTVPDWLVGSHFDTIYWWADNIFRQGVCREPSPRESDSFEEMSLWLRQVTGVSSRFNFTVASFAIGVLGLGLSAYLIWKGRR